MILEIENLTKSFGEKNNKRFVFKDISFTVNSGDFLCLLGPSGCGKSTLLKELASFDVPDSGDILLNKENIKKPQRNRVMIFQDFDQLFPWQTVLKNVLFPLKANKIGSSNSERIEIAKKYLTLVNMQDYLDYYPHELSGGMKQRVSIARALAIKPEILLMDEPFGSLDAQTRTTLQKMLIDIWKKTNTTIIFVTHDIQEAILLSNRILVMGYYPENIKSIIENDLPRPRTIGDEGSLTLYREIYKLLES
jgi:NitT/TauT family transport system ATP-binding protein